MRGVYLVLLFFAAAAPGADGQVRLPRFFSDHMILQRGRPIHFWGRGVPGETVKAHFSGITRTVRVKADSSWSIFFPARRASVAGAMVSFGSGGRTVVLRDVLIGDVWVCSGQSNMEFPFQKEAHAADEYAQTRQPLIRFCNPAPVGRYVYGVAYTDSLLRRLNKDSFYLWDGWRRCDSSTVGPMSAVAYYFARKIVAETGVPVGLINLSIGGAPIETFISRGALAASRRFAGKVRAGNWLDNDALPAWTRERGRENVGGAVDHGGSHAGGASGSRAGGASGSHAGRVSGSDAARVSGSDAGGGPNHAYKPGFAFACGVGPLLPMPVKGVIWYQGESNSLEPARVEEYPALMRLLIDDYRRRWHSPDMPFYWVQLSSIDTIHYQSRYWPEFRDGQRRLLAEVHHGGMAVCSDLGFRDNVHPTDKKDVGERLARWALRRDYGRTVVVSGPLPVAARFSHGEVVVSFRYGRGLRTSDGKSVREFSTDGRRDVPVKISGSTVRIAVGEKPAFVYYGWHPYAYGNLVNGEGLPASTFKMKVQ